MPVEAALSRYAERGPIGSPGFPVPSGAFRSFNTDTPGDIDSLKGLGAFVTTTGGNNTVWVEEGFSTPAFEIGFNGHSGNCVVLGAGLALGGRIHFMNSDCLAVLCGGQLHSVNILCDGLRTIFYCGPNCHVGDMTCWVQGESRILAIGEDCMFGWAIGIRTGDFHGLYELASGKVLNLVQDTTIGPHVWLTNTIQVMKGVHINAGAAVGAGSIVNKDLPKSCLAAGSPARVLRRGIGWSRSPAPADWERAELAGRSYMAPDLGALEISAKPTPTLRPFLKPLRGFARRLAASFR